MTCTPGCNSKPGKDLDRAEKADAGKTEAGFRGL